MFLATVGAGLNTDSGCGLTGHTVGTDACSVDCMPNYKSSGTTRCLDSTPTYSIAPVCTPRMSPHTQLWLVTVLHCIEPVCGKYPMLPLVLAGHIRQHTPSGPMWGLGAGMLPADHLHRIHKVSMTLPLFPPHHSNMRRMVTSGGCTYHWNMYIQLCKGHPMHTCM